MNKIFAKLKQLFTKEKNKEAEEMWNKLSDPYSGDPESHPDLDLDASYALRLNRKDRHKYLYDLMMRRQAAHDDHSS